MIILSSIFFVILALCGLIVGFSLLCHWWTRRNGLIFHRDEEGRLMVSHAEALASLKGNSR